MSSRLAAAELCDERFLASLEALRLVARRVAPRGRFAEQRSRALGGGFEFKDYRPYAAGDDLRSVDWNLYRRLGRVFVRLCEELEDLPLYLLPDVSKSAWLEDPPRALAGLRASLALAAISLGQHDKVGIFPFDTDLRVLQRPTSGKNRILQFAQLCSGLEPAPGLDGATDLPRSLARFQALGLREGLVCVVSDFFDPAGIDAVIAALHGVRSKLLLVQLVRKSDAQPALTGDLRLSDCESGAVTDVSITPAVLERYRAAHARFDAALADFARARQAGLVKLDVDADVVAQLAKLFEAGTQLV
ncbi:MAG: DUF58 domain-containing protein [Planctomycetes bacterium]|nr:DUF58 domain-containing protein [Planctomycetota bacterium]